LYSAENSAFVNPLYDFLKNIFLGAPLVLSGNFAPKLGSYGVSY